MYFRKFIYYGAVPVPLYCFLPFLLNPVPAYAVQVKYGPLHNGKRGVRKVSMRM